jgi:hypothetical protein
LCGNEKGKLNYDQKEPPTDHHRKLSEYWTRRLSTFKRADDDRRREGSPSPAPLLGEPCAIAGPRQDERHRSVSDRRWLIRAAGGTRCAAIVLDASTNRAEDRRAMCASRQRLAQLIYILEREAWFAYRETMQDRHSRIEPNRIQDDVVAVIKL